MRRLQATDEYPGGPVGCRGHGGRRVRDNAAEILVLGYLDGQHMARSLAERPPRPQDNAVRIWIAGRHAFRVDRALFPPLDARCAGRPTPGQ